MLMHFLNKTPKHQVERFKNTYFTPSNRRSGKKVEHFEVQKFTIEPELGPLEFLNIKALFFILFLSYFIKLCGTEQK